MKKIGIIGAMQVEVETLVAAMAGEDGTGEARVVESGGLRFHCGSIDGIRVVVAKSGVGKVNAALCAQSLALEFGATHIINTGIAGGVAKGLRVFDVVVSTDAMYYDMDATGFGYAPGKIPQMEVSEFKADEKMIEAVEKAFASTEYSRGRKLVRGRVATGDAFVSERGAKERIKKICAPACVEMEGAGVAHACFLRGIPFVIARCISDMADDGEEAAYAFNEKSCAEQSAAITRAFLSFMR